MKSRKIPPMNGKIQFGKEYTLYSSPKSVGPILNS